MPLELTAERLREVLHYDPATGLFRWRVTLSHRNKAGGIAGSVHRKLGCIYIGVDGKSRKAHRLAWLYVTGQWPEKCIDHADGDHANNRWNNLREATQAENSQNLVRPHKDNRYGLLGVQRRAPAKFFARLTVRGERHDSESFDTPEEAHAAYLRLKAIHHPFATITKDTACSN